MGAWIGCVKATTSTQLTFFESNSSESTIKITSLRVWETGLLYKHLGAVNLIFFLNIHLVIWNSTNVSGSLYCVEFHEDLSAINIFLVKDPPSKRNNDGGHFLNQHQQPKQPAPRTSSFYAEARDKIALLCTQQLLSCTHLKFVAPSAKCKSDHTQTLTQTNSASHFISRYCTVLYCTDRRVHRKPHVTRTFYFKIQKLPPSPVSYLLSSF